MPRWLIVTVIVGVIFLFIGLTFWISPTESPEVARQARATALAQLTPTVTPLPNCEVVARDAPFGYIPDAPVTDTLAPPDFPGERIVITGTVYADDCRTPLVDVLVEVWHADEDGQYDRQPPYYLRGQLRTDEQGVYLYESIKPGSYDIGGSPAPAHVHYRLVFADEGSFSTRLLFEGDPYLTTEPESIIIPLTERDGARGVQQYGQFDIVLPIAPPTPAPTPTPIVEL